MKRIIAFCMTIVLISATSIYAFASKTDISSIKATNFEEMFEALLRRNPPPINYFPTSEPTDEPPPPTEPVTSKPTEQTEPKTEPTEPITVEPTEPTEPPEPTTVTPTTAEPTETTEPTEYTVSPTEKPIYYHYREEYKYSPTGSKNDGYVLVNAYSQDGINSFNQIYGVFGDRVLFSYVDTYPFNLSWGVYDIKKDEWVDLCVAWDDEERFPTLHEYFENKKIGRLIGDLDEDNELTILDVTYIQKCLACILPWPNNDTSVKYFTPVHGEIKYISDFNRDGSRDIIDGAMIQKKLAYLEE